MSRRKNQIKGLSLFEDSIKDIFESDLQHINLECIKYSLDNNSAKIIIYTITQMIMNVGDSNGCTMSTQELANILTIPVSDIEKDIEGIIDGIVKKCISMYKTSNGKISRFAKIPWVGRCEYRYTEGLTICLNSELKPYLNQIRLILLGDLEKCCCADKRRIE